MYLFLQFSMFVLDQNFLYGFIQPFEMEFNIAINSLNPSLLCSNFAVYFKQFSRQILCWSSIGEILSWTLGENSTRHRWCGLMRERDTSPPQISAALPVTSTSSMTQWRYGHVTAACLSVCLSVRMITKTII